jgi:hypothetical protein
MVYTQNSPEITNLHRRTSRRAHYFFLFFYCFKLAENEVKQLVEKAINLCAFSFFTISFHPDNT